MAKVKISEFSSTAGNNTDIDGINLAEGMAPSLVNDAIRELMAQLKDFQAGTAGDSFNGPIGTSTAAAGAFTTLSASSTVTLSGGTANGVTYLNGSKVLTSGSALTFDGSALTVDAHVNVNGGDIRFDDDRFVYSYSGGSVGQYRAGFYLDGAGTNIRHYINNTEGMRLTSTGLGIGTSSPAYKLDLKMSSSARTGGFVIRRSTNDNHQLGLWTTGGAMYFDAVTDNSAGAGTTIFRRSGDSGSTFTESMVIDSAGNLGLGVTPSAWYTGYSNKAFQFGVGALQSLNVSSSDMRVSLINNAYDDVSGNNIYLNTGYATKFQSNGGAFKWFTAPSGTAGNAISFTQAMTLDASGNLGVGTTSPVGRLDVVGNYARFFENASGAEVYIRGYYGSASVAAIQVASNSPLAFLTNNTERARIDSSGNLLVGQTSKSQSTVGFYASGNGEVSGCQAGTTSSNTQWNTYSTGAGAYRFYVGMQGTVYATNTTITAISDQRLKENIVDLDVGLDAIMALKPRKFDWKTGKGKDIKGDRGWIAQEFETVFPDLIDTWKDPAPEGEEPYKSVRADLIPVLVKALQEQQVIIESLKARLDAANL